MGGVRRCGQGSEPGAAKPFKSRRIIPCYPDGTATGRERAQRSAGATAGGCPRYMVLRRTRGFLEKFSLSMWGSREKNIRIKTDGFARSSRDRGERTCSAERSCPLLEQQARIGPMWACGVPRPGLRPRFFIHKMRCPGGKRALRRCRVDMLVTASRDAGLPGSQRSAKSRPPCSAAASIRLLPID